MQRRIVFILTAALVVGLIAGLEAPAAQSGQRHLVVYDGAAVASLSSDVAAAGGFLDWRHDGVGLALVAGLDATAAADLAGAPGIRSVEVEATYSLAALAGDSDGGAAQQPAAAAGSGVDPTDAAFYPWQWNLAAIDAQEAWDAGYFGASSITVAVLDSGIDAQHPDLAGLVDLSRSASLVPYEDPLVEAMFPGRHPVTDMNGHGTFVASVISSNAGLLAGVTRDTTLIGLKVCDYTGDCLEGATLAGIVQAVDAGADVINMSVGGYGGSIGRSEMPGLAAAINRTMNYAHRNGVTVVNSAGNLSTDMSHNGNDYVPYCDAPHVICVSATGPTSGGFGGPWTDVDNLASYTNFGNQITVAAPGGNVVTGPPTNGFGVVWGACPSTLLNPTFFQAAFCGLGIQPNIGTSMATPAVAGLAALLVQQHGRNPQRIALEIRKGAVDLGKNGRDPFYGFGRIDVGASLKVQ